MAAIESNKIRTTVREQGDLDDDIMPDSANDDVAVVIDYFEHGQQLWLDIVDDQFTYGQGVLIEIWEGELRVIVWADPEQEDPTHTIPIRSLSDASESFQKEYAQMMDEVTNPECPGR